MIRKAIRSIGISVLLLSSINLFAQNRGDDQKNPQGNYEGNENDPGLSCRQIMRPETTKGLRSFSIALMAS